MEIKQDLIMNFDFRTYCANFFAGQSKTAKEIIVEFERVTHTTGLFKLEPLAEDRLFILDDAGGLKAADGVTFLFVPQRNMRVSYDSKREDIDINYTTGITMSVLHELSWNIDLYNDNWGYQVNSQNLENMMSNSSQFLSLTKEELNNDLIIKSNTTLDSHGLSNVDKVDESYAIPRFLWNDTLIYNMGSQDALNGFNYTLPDNFVYPKYLFTEQMTDKDLWGYERINRVIYDNLAEKDTAQYIKIQKKEDNNFILSIDSSSQKRTIPFKWSNPTDRLYIFRIHPTLLNSTDIEPLLQKWQIVFGQTEKQLYTTLGNLDDASYQITVLHPSAITSTINIKQLAPYIADLDLKQLDKQQQTYASFSQEEISDEVDVLNLTNWSPITNTMKELLWSNSSINSTVNWQINENQEYKQYMKNQPQGSTSYQDRWVEAGENTDFALKNQWITQEQLLSKNNQLTIHYTYPSITSNIFDAQWTKTDNIVNDLYHSWFPFNDDLSNYAFWYDFHQNLEVFLGNGTFALPKTNLIQLSNDTQTGTSPNPNTRKGWSASTYSDSLSSIIQNYWLNGAYQSNASMVFDYNIELTPASQLLTYHTDYEHSLSVVTLPTANFINLQCNLTFISNERYIIAILNPNHIGDINDDNNKSITFYNGTDTTNIQSTVTLQSGLPDRPLETQVLTINNKKFSFTKENSNLIQFNIKENIINGFGIKELLTEEQIYTDETLKLDSNFYTLNYYNSVTLTWIRKYIPIAIQYIDTMLPFSVQFYNTLYNSNGSNYLWVPFNKEIKYKLNWDAQELDLTRPIVAVNKNGNNIVLLQDTFNLTINKILHTQTDAVPIVLNIKPDTQSTFKKEIKYNFTLQKQGNIYLLRVDNFTFDENYISASLYFGVNATIQADEGGIKSLLKDKPTSKTFFRGLSTTVSLSGQSSYDTQMALLVTYQTHNGKTLYGIATFDNIIMYDGAEHTWNGTTQLFQAVIDN